MKSRWVQIGAVLGLLACLVAGALLTGPINAQRHKLQFGYVPNAPQATEQKAVTTLTTAALGAFRGLAADILWYRANRLKDEGKYHEANQLSEWITTLQPSFAPVWVFHAWNMAYNISVATYTPEERWDWVCKGIALLRDRAIPLNPQAVVLYKELYWIFFHKIGGNADDMHWYYKQQLAAEWQEVLGAPAEGATLEQAIRPFQEIVAAPDTWGEFQRQHSEGQSLGDELSRLGYQPGETLLRQIGRILMYNYSEDARMFGLDIKARPDLYDSLLVDLFQQPDNKKNLPPLLAFLRKQVLRQTYHMDPQFMLEMMQPEAQGGYGFGPLDWRHPATQGLYWAFLGTRMAAVVKGDQAKVDLLNTYRSCIQAFQALTDSGRITFDPVSGHIDMLPDPRFIPLYEKAMEMAFKDIEKGHALGNPKESYQAGHQNFLLKAIVYSYLYGSVQDAQAYYDRLRKLYGNRPDNIVSGRFTRPLADLVLDELTQNLDTLQFARQFIDSMLIQAFKEGLGNDRPEVYEHFVELAAKVHKKNYDRTIATPNAPQRRLAFLPFEQVMAETYLGFMEAPSVSLLLRARIWRNTPVPLKQQTFDRLHERLYEQCKNEGFTAERAFPQPPGMAEYRQTHEQALPRKPAAPVEIERQ